MMSCRPVSLQKLNIEDIGGQDTNSEWKKEWLLYPYLIDAKKEEEFM